MDTGFHDGVVGYEMLNDALGWNQLVDYEGDLDVVGEAILAVDDLTFPFVARFTVSGSAKVIQKTKTCQMIGN
jgi:hypothetical protein